PPLHRHRAVPPPFPRTPRRPPRAPPFPYTTLFRSARTVTRRAERLVCALAAEERVNPEAVKYLNRLSDHLFVLGRRVNDNGAKEDRKSTRLNSSHASISYAVFCLKKKRTVSPGLWQ